MIPHTSGLRCPKSVELHLRSIVFSFRYPETYGRTFLNPSEVIHQNLLSDAKQAHPALRQDVSVGMLFLIGSRLSVFDWGPYPSNLPE